ncbi:MULTISPECIES: rRNA maturation RNase YbeY [unclassified Novosphingobium]|uniref:rRNA maturation RNase YbeY n=1 Tax=unclassified Novosphingobium TaxID=2644732 RepID=UPI000ED9A2DD|nr:MULTISPECIES: rRNA maturation RNase YbeY [unclassified Novosphingobium]HCF24697.1 rRNA maturation RNase YbeY [Novosphingobium sp.]HQV04890.1 rRNA maturation RNase YbeY [Novosphingobium sp.]
MELEIDIAASWPSPPDWEELTALAAAALSQTVPELANPRLSVSILFADDAEVHALNAEWRGKDKPTNVLSFPMLEREELLALGPDGPPELLGDIALALETCTREAVDKGIGLEHHATHLIVHGLLHLAGYDHETSPEDARAMERLEIKALALLAIADPYGDHDEQ